MNKQLHLVVFTIVLTGVTACNVDTQYDVASKFEMMSEKLSLKDAEGAIKIGLEAEHIVKTKAYRIEDAPLLAVQLSSLSTVYFHEEEYDRAVETALLAESILTEDHGVRTYFYVLEPLRQSLVQTNQFESALPYAVKMVSLYEEYINRMMPSNPYKVILENHIDLAIIYRNCGRIDDALNIISEWPMYLEPYLSELDDQGSSSRDFVTLSIIVELHALMPTIREYKYWDTLIEIGELLWNEIDNLEDLSIEMKTLMAIQLMEAHTVLENYANALYYCDYIHDHGLMPPPHCDACAEEKAHVYNCKSLLKDHISNQE